MLGPMNEVSFDPDEYPLDLDTRVHALTQVVRGLRLGGRVALPNGIKVVSRTVQIGPHQERRFTVLPSAERTSAKERHQIMALAHGAHKRAEEAARKALEMR